MLTAEQLQDFRTRGLTRMPGALEDPLRRGMLEQIWEALGERHGMRRDDQATWKEGIVLKIGDVNRRPAFRPFGNDCVIDALDQLMNAGNWSSPASWGQILVTFPAEQWDWNSLFQGAVNVSNISWHTDYPYDKPANHLVGVQVFGLLDDIESGGGATLVITGSHRLIQRFAARQTPETLAKMKRARVALIKEYEWLQDVSQAVSAERPEAWIAAHQTTLDNVPVAVTQLTGKAGDVYLTHPWLLHATAPNCNSTPRMMVTQRIDATNPVPLSIE